MKHLWVRATVVLLALLIVAGILGQASTIYSNRYKLGETVLFKVDDSGGSWWSCCCQCDTCSDTQVLGWRIANSSGQTIFSVVHDAPVLASTWQGSWVQVDSTGGAVAAGSYVLYVDTSVGTLSRFINLYDPCNYCGWSWGWSCNTCQQEQATITTHCYCKTSLVLARESSTCNSCWWPFFRWPCSSSCSSGCSSGCP